LAQHLEVVTHLRYNASRVFLLEVGVPSGRQPSSKPAPTIVNATARTRSVIENLQARLAAEASGRSPDEASSPLPPTQQENAPQDPGHEESLDDLERQLQAYFDRPAPTPSPAKILDELRNRVVDGVVDRILAEWANPQLADAGLRQEVMDRLIERVLEEFKNKVKTGR
jgi:hypothetical protein